MPLTVKFGLIEPSDSGCQFEGRDILDKRELFWLIFQMLLGLQGLRL
jgi:hypothetical protein